MDQQNNKLHMDLMIEGYPTDVREAIATIATYSRRGGKVGPVARAALGYALATMDTSRRVSTPPRVDEIEEAC